MWIEISSLKRYAVNLASRLARALWIEIIALNLSGSSSFMSRLARALWIEIHLKTTGEVTSKPSRLARALWIEMALSLANSISCSVEARESLVD